MEQFLTKVFDEQFQVTLEEPPPLERSPQPDAASRLAALREKLGTAQTQVNASSSAAKPPRAAEPAKAAGGTPRKEARRPRVTAAQAKLLEEQLLEVERAAAAVEERRAQVEVER
eukprot:RCo051147